MQDVSLEGLRVLILEDEVLIALDLEQACRDFGAAEVVIARTLDEAAAIDVAFDVAVLDVMLDGRSTLVFAAGLSARGVPFVFATGYGDIERLLGESGEMLDIADVQVVDKPFASDALVRAIITAIERRNRPA